MDAADKLAVLADAAKYDVACTSSGVDRDARLGHLGATSCAGICHSFSADGRCITLLKVLLTNYCVYDCAYCANRRSNDIPRVALTPRELADITIGFYRRNYIEGLFLSSGVLRSPDHTMELICRTLSILRDDYGFNGYIHAKAIPGASPELIERAGMLADRMSINVELPSERSLRVLAPDKSLPDVASSMGYIAARSEEDGSTRSITKAHGARFAPAGQSTQLIVGASPESDLDILSLSSGLYRSYGLKRVFFSAYLPHNTDELLPDASVTVPLDREHRLYQADWLMRFYGFSVNEIVDDEHPFLDPDLDPKITWALSHFDEFPIEIITAPYETLLRVPGLGVRGARRIVKARHHRSLTHDDLKQLGLSLKRMRYFIVCSGQYRSPLPFDHDRIRRQLVLDGKRAGKPRRSGGREPLEGQLSLFDSPEVAGTHAQPHLQLGQVQAFEAQARRLRVLDGGGRGQAAGRSSASGSSRAGEATPVERAS